MRRETLQEAANARPFQPFVLKSLSGQVYRVMGPDWIMLPPTKRIAVLLDEGNRLAQVDLPMLESLTFIENDEKGAA